MKSLALVLEKKRELSLRNIELVSDLGPTDVRIAIRIVGICGSDVHYYQHGAIGPFVVKEPMVLGHEASGLVIETGSAVQALRPGDRVCMEPGVPDFRSRAARLGIYNLDPAVRFWATPPVHGCLTPTIVHPADFTFKIPDNVSFAEAAMVEPLAVGMHAATRAAIRPGDVALVMGAGAIGMVTALSALAAGCARVLISDVQAPKLALAARLGPITPVDITQRNLKQAVMDATGGWGADVIFEASGNARAFEGIFDLLCPAGRVVLIGMPGQAVPFDVVGAQVKEANIVTIFRYAHVFDRALALMGAGKIDVKPLITDTYSFSDSIAAFEYACTMRPTSVKVQIAFPETQ
jgi:D-xylulose reductase